ncbi:MAG: hypothetical protein WAS21_22720 [Geminicoccaceae bacterium]
MILIEFGFRSMVALTILLAVVSAGRLLKVGLRGSGLTATPAGEFSPARIQALLVSVGASVLYLGEVLLGGGEVLPPPSSTVTTLLGLSGGVYLSGKIAPGVIGSLFSQALDVFTRPNISTNSKKS